MEASSQCPSNLQIALMSLVFRTNEDQQHENLPLITTLSLHLWWIVEYFPRGIGMPGIPSQDAGRNNLFIAL